MTVNCPECGHAAQLTWQGFAAKSHPQEFSIHTCADCGLLFTWPQPNEELLARLYADPAYTELIMEPSLSPALDPLNDARCELLARFRKPPGRLLEIGSGEGHFLLSARQAGWRVTGLELDPERARQSGQSYGLDILTLDFLDTNLPEAEWDAIALWDVFEHFPEPSKQLARIARLLKPGGCCIFAVPNATAAEIGWFGPHWIGWWVPMHLYHYTPVALERLMRSAGLQPVHMDATHLPWISEQSWERWQGAELSEWGCFPARPSFTARLGRKLLHRIPGLRAWLNARMAAWMTRQAGTPDQLRGNHLTVVGVRD